MNVSETEKLMHSGKIYYPSDENLLKLQAEHLNKLYDYNATRPTEGDKRQKMLKEMFAEVGKDCYIEPPLHSNWGGRHVHLGNNVYFNFNATLVDDTHIYIGDCTMLGPNVVIATADSKRQLDAAVSNVEDEVYKNGYKVRGVEGKNGGTWILIDLNDILVNVFYKEEREKYGLDKKVKNIMLLYNILILY